jgi:hypothetical protein
VIYGPSACAVKIVLILATLNQLDDKCTICTGRNLEGMSTSATGYFCDRRGCITFGNLVPLALGAPGEKLPASIAMLSDIDHKALTAAILPANHGRLSGSETHGSNVTCLTFLGPRHPRR